MARAVALLAAHAEKKEPTALDALTALFKPGCIVEMPGHPQTIGYALTDRPVGLAAWMLDHDTDSYEKISRAFWRVMPARRRLLLSSLNLLSSRRKTSSGTATFSVPSDRMRAISARRRSVGIASANLVRVGALATPPLKPASPRQRAASERASRASSGQSQD